MTNECPSNVRVLQLVDTDFPGESAIRLVVNILSGNLKTFAQVVSGKEKI